MYTRVRFPDSAGKEECMGLLKEFRAFAVNGHVVDRALGVIIGAAFGAIVSSFTSDLRMAIPLKATRCGHCASELKQA